MLKKLRKSSGRVTLVLIGLSALSGCGGEDCLADWAAKPEDCTPATEPRHRSSGFFYGPMYGHRSAGSGSSWASRSIGRSIGSSTSGSSRSSSISRGGFGSSGRSSAS